MLHSLRTRLLECSLQAWDRSVAAPLVGQGDPVAQHWHEVLTDAGVELERVIRVREDTRGVFIVRHPTHGRCVLKTLFSARHGERALANYLIAKHVADTAPPIFPRVFVATEDYTLEAFVDGWPLRQWMRTDFAPETVTEFFRAFKQWSQHTPFGCSSPTLHACEVREICHSYIHKCFWLSRYCSPLTNLASISRLASIGSDLRQRISRLGTLADSVALPRTLMCGDMGNVNLMVERSSRRMFNIDYEFMNSGHWGFDCAYFLSSLYKMRHSPADIAPFEQQVMSDEYLGGAAAGEFFRLYTSILRDVSMLWFRPKAADAGGPLVQGKEASSVAPVPLRPLGT